MMKNKMIKKEQGITLIALVVTITILLLLAATSISMLAGENGIITQANKASVESRGANIQEERDLWLQEREIAKKTGQTPKTMEEILNELKEKGTLTYEEVKEILNNENNEIKIGDRVISFYVGIDIIEPENIEDWEYIIEDDGTATLINYKGKATEIIVPNYIDGIPVKKITGSGNPASDGSTQVSIWDTSICDGFMGVGGSARAPMQNTITRITISYGIETIGQYTFFATSMLSDIYIPNSVTNIEKYAFYYCSSLTNITIPSNVTSIGHSTFYGCSSLTNITIPDGVTSIGNMAFYYCESLTNITIPDSVTSIENSAFSGCSSLTNITIPESVTSIGYMAFDGCSSLTNITIPDSVTSIGNYAFNGCSSLTTINIEATSIPETWDSEWKGDCTATINLGFAMD